MSNSNKTTVVELSINKRIVNKPEQRLIGLNQNHFEKVSLTREQFIEAVCINGSAFTPAIFTDNIRQKSHFKGAQMVVLDVDDGDLEKALEDERLKQWEALLYTTPNHGKDGKDKYRIVIFLPDCITDVGRYESMLRGLLIGFQEADTSCKDASRMFFGSAGCQYHDFGSNKSGGSN